jgi:SAM-dependent methyltransferase
MRERLARQLRGRGIELGPGHQPMQIPARAEVRYVDRWKPEENASLYPELPPGAPFPRPDVIADFDVDRLSAIESSSEDFVVCSHVLEHLADVLGFMEEMYRVLRPGGLLLVLLPDRHLTFDRHRAPTPLAHLIEDHANRVTVVDDDHVREFLEHADPPEAAFLDLPDDPDAHPAFFDWHRHRSIHVHCWDEPEFDEVLEYCSGMLGERWKHVDTIHSTETGMEFGYLLKKRRSAWRPSERAKSSAPV